MTNAWIVHRTPKKAAKVRLFCFPYAGASGVVYHEWQALMPDSVDVCAICPPGRFGRQNEEPILTIQAFVAALGVALGALIDRPIAVFGYSHGAVVAYEWVRWLKIEIGIEPCSLSVAASRAPHIGPRLDPITHLPDPLFLQELEYRFGAFAPAIRSDPEMLRVALRAIRADLRMLESYRRSDAQKLNCPLYALGGTDDITVSPEDLEAWRTHSAGASQVELFDGGHFFMRQHNRRICERVRDQLSTLGTI